MNKKEVSMLQLDQVSYKAGNKTILHPVSATFIPGQFYMILGPNGAGKSSLLKLISGEEEPETGVVYYDQVNIRQRSKASLARCRAVLSQLPELHFPLTVEEVVMMGRYPHFELNPQRIDIEICDEYIRLLNLEPFRQRNYLTLSGGEKQRVQFARVLSQLGKAVSAEPRYLLLDEPLSSLDINYQQEFLRIARQLLHADTNLTLIAVMHDINLALQFADQVLLLKDGHEVGNASPAKLLEPELIAAVFGVQCSTVPHPVTGVPLIAFH